MNLSLILRKYNIMGILGTPVSVHLGPVPIQVAFCWPVSVQVGLWWAVPVQPCTCTGTPSGNCPDLLFFATFGTISIHTTSIIHIPQELTWNSSKNNSITLELVLWNFITQTLGENPKNPT